MNEVYRIKTSGKFHTFEPLYKRGEGERYSFLARHQRPTSMRFLPRVRFRFAVIIGSEVQIRFRS